MSRQVVSVILDVKMEKVQILVFYMSHALGPKLDILSLRCLRLLSLGKQEGVCFKD